MLTQQNSQSFHRFLYAGNLQTVVLLKRGNDQQEGTVTAYTLFECWRDNIHKSGEPIQGDMAVTHTVQWLIPNMFLRRVGVNYINVLDRIIDKLNMWWQPEAPQTISLSQMDNYTIVPCVRVDPSPNPVYLGIPEFTTLVAAQPPAPGLTGTIGG